jgi:site-specific DNA recombinase
MKIPSLPCAIYTRKSSEDGLEQGFNSLDAQREASEAYILSQKAQGWVCMDSAYEDGGFSGGNTERPGLKRLLAEVVLGRVKIVVVYKVDRLTRSLADFAKLVELFDAHGVSFVSVTQQFNTTSSMGRLTLNVLLSFAQFEREVTGERIRDKIAASKRKGLWMGGVAPVGYLPHERTLVIDEPQAARIREIYALYLRLGCVRRLKQELERLDWVTPLRNSRRAGQQGGKSFSRGHLYRILTNPIYTGKIAHKDAVFPGQHPAIIDALTWDRVQGTLKSNLQGHRTRATAVNPSLLTGLVFDEHSNPLTPTHAKKGERRYRYYSSLALLKEGRQAAPDAIRLPAHELENAVLQALCRFMKDESRLLEWMATRGIVAAAQVRGRLQQVHKVAEQMRVMNPAGKITLLQRVANRVTVQANKIQIGINTAAIWDDNASNSDNAESREATTLIEVPVQLKRCGLTVRMIVRVPGHASSRVDPKLIGLIGKAHDWFERLSSGRRDGVIAIAKEESISNDYISRVINLAFLAPDIVQRIHRGEQPPDLNAERLIRMVPLPLEWDKQREILGMSG